MVWAHSARVRSVKGRMSPLPAFTIADRAFAPYLLPRVGLRAALLKLNHPSWEPERRTWRVEPRCGHKGPHGDEKHRTWRTPQKNQTTHMGIGRRTWRTRTTQYCTRRVCLFPLGDLRSANGRTTHQQLAQLVSFPQVRASHDVGTLYVTQVTQRS